MPQVHLKSPCVPRNVRTVCYSRYHWAADGTYIVKVKRRNPIRTLSLFSADRVSNPEHGRAEHYSVPNETYNDTLASDSHPFSIHGFAVLAHCLASTLGDHTFLERVGG